MNELTMNTLNYLRARYDYVIGKNKSYLYPELETREGTLKLLDNMYHENRREFDSYTTDQIANYGRPREKQNNPTFYVYHIKRCELQDSIIRDAITAYKNIAVGEEKILFHTIKSLEDMMETLKNEYH